MQAYPIPFGSGALAGARLIPLILVPGHLCGAWLYPSTVLPDGFAVLPLADTAQDDRIDAMADRLLNNAPDRFAVAGLSMGGMIAMEVIGKAPDRVMGACLMDTDPRSARPREVGWRNDLLDQGMSVYVDTFVERFYMHDPVTAESLGPPTRRNMGAVPEGIARAQARALDTRRDMIPLIDGYSGPVEIIVGVEDRVCPPLLHQELSEALSGARLTEIPGCGHIATLERPQEIRRSLDRLAKCIASDIDG